MYRQFGPKMCVKSHRYFKSLLVGQVLCLSKASVSSPVKWVYQYLPTTAVMRIKCVYVARVSGYLRDSTNMCNDYFIADMCSFLIRKKILVHAILKYFRRISDEMGNKNNIKYKSRIQIMHVAVIPFCKCTHIHKVHFKNT